MAARFSVVSGRSKRGRKCKEFMGGGGGVGYSGPIILMILQRHYDTEAQTDISILMADAPYFYLLCFPQFLLFRKWQTVG